MEKPVSLRPLLVVRVPEQEQRVEGVELGQIGHNIGRKVKMLEFEQEVAGHSLRQSALRDVWRAAQEPVRTKSKAVLLSIGKEQHTATVFEEAHQVIVKARGNHDALAAVRVRSATAREKLCGECRRDGGVQLDVFEGIRGWGRHDPDRPFIAPLAILVFEADADDQMGWA